MPKVITEVDTVLKQKVLGSTDLGTSEKVAFPKNSQFEVAQKAKAQTFNSQKYSEEFRKEFWWQWQQYQDTLYHCCIKWMGGNSIDAEDALSRAMLKAWEKAQKYAEGEISNFKSWLIRLTHNLCIDIHRERNRGASRVENIEDYASNEVQELVSCRKTPDSSMETDEERIIIRRAIDNLPTRLRETFILHFYQELSHLEIAQLQEISYQNVCKRISQARAILRECLREYFIGESRTNLIVKPTSNATESAIGEMLQESTRFEASVNESVTLPPLVEEVESVVDGNPQELVRSTQHLESVTTAVSGETLGVKKDLYRCVDAELYKSWFATILAKTAPFGRKTASWQNSYQAIQEQKGVLGRKEWIKPLLLSRSPPFLSSPSS